MSPRPIEEATIRSDVIGETHDPYGAVRDSAMTRFPNLACAKPIRRSEGAAVKRGTYQRRLIVCYPAPIEAEGEGEDRFGADSGGIVEPAMAGARSDAARPLPRVTTRALPRVTTRGPGYLSPGYPQAPQGYGEAQWAQCQQLEQAEREIAGRLQFTPPSPERAAMEQQLRDIGAARQSCWPR
jgi:hypothetical protein